MHQGRRVAADINAIAPHGEPVLFKKQLNLRKLSPKIKMKKKKKIISKNSLLNP
jgi:hypothetical protein